MIKDIIDYVNNTKDLGTINRPDIYWWVENRCDDNTDVAEAEHIIDYLQSHIKPKNLKRVTYNQCKKLADDWVKKLNKKSDKIQEKPEDTQIIKKWTNGFKIVQLIGENAFKREGYLMRHCVGGYFDKSETIYSLRDKDNLPHATMSVESNQIKGKGNGSIHPKYVKYIVEFLEEQGIGVRDSEMANLGYVNFEEYKDECNKKDLFKDKYFYKNNIDKLKNKNQLKFWNLFGLVEFDRNFKFKLKFDIEKCVSHSLKIINKGLGRDYSTNAGGYYSTNVGRESSTNVGGESSTNVGGDRSTNVGGYYSTNVGRYSSTNAGGDYSTNAGNNYSTNAGRDYSTNVGRYSSTNAGGDRSTNVGGDYSTNAGGYYSTNVGGERSTLVLNGKNAIAVGNKNSKCKGVVGSAFALPVYDKEGETITKMISVVVDGKKIKEDTYYCVYKGKLVEWYCGIYD